MAKAVVPFAGYTLESIPLILMTNLIPGEIREDAARSGA
jgi:hypothetical protein